MSNETKRQLFVVEGGPDSCLNGPVTRLNLRERFPVVSKQELAIVIGMKLLLLSGMLYFIWR